MSSEGNIAIWNYSKLISKFPEVKNNTIFRNIIGGFVYKNPFKPGNELLITYSGDNFYFPNGFFPDYNAEEWLQNFSNFKLTSLEKNKLGIILNFLVNNSKQNSKR